MQLCSFGLLISFSVSLFSLSESKLWALLVAGSRGYRNYRHQADICHAYQILRHNNVSAENIITMMYDDIANNESICEGLANFIIYSTNKKNPFPGTIINQPGGKNVYAGVAKDYTGPDVNSTNFINILLGNKKALRSIGNERVIESGPNDTIFVNFVDHGGPGVLCFPASELSVKELIEALTHMRNKKKFKKLVLYIEACYSGSMFDDILADNDGIYAMTAADPNESSWACYYDEERQAYLGDVFSVNWMQESENENLKAHSLHHIFQRVRTETDPSSHVEEYGDLDVAGNSSISEILGSHDMINSNGVFNTYQKDVGKDAVNSHEVPLRILHMELQKLEKINAKSEIQIVRNKMRTIMENRQLVENVMDKLIFRLTRKNVRSSVKLRDKKVSINRRNIDCYDKVLKQFSNTCFKISTNPYVATQLHVLINACDLFKNEESKITRCIRQVCGKLQPMTNIV